MARRWDLLCRVIDNYGDAAVGWRLARQLVAEHGLDVTLWLDDLATLACLQPAVDVSRDEQCLDGVRLRRWLPGQALPLDGEVIVELFACELPPDTVQGLAQRQRPPVWFNLEYLSAEDWVEGCHAQVSIHPATGLKKRFFFPGFTPSTGGLLREQDWRLRFTLTAAERDAFLTRLGMPRVVSATYLSLFTYADAPVEAALQVLRAGRQPVVCLLAAGAATQAAASYVGLALKAGQVWQRDALTAVALPFLPQDDYDRLLACCDLNIVRGEDSFLRAQWAGKPLIWNTYPQEDGAHAVKLAAFLRRYLAGWPPELAAALQTLNRDWNTGQVSPSDLQAVIGQLPQARQAAEAWRDKLAQQADLAAQLVKMAANSL